MGDTDNEKRSSVFTVRDAENAMMTFTVFAIATVVGVFLHEIVLKRNSVTDGLYAVMHIRLFGYAQGVGKKILWNSIRYSR